MKRSSGAGSSRTQIGGRSTGRRLVDRPPGEHRRTGYRPGPCRATSSASPRRGSPTRRRAWSRGSSPSSPSRSTPTTSPRPSWATPRRCSRRSSWPASSCASASARRSCASTSTTTTSLHRDRLARRTTSFVLVTSTVAALVAVVFAGAISQALLGTRDATLMAYGVLGLWAFTNLEIAYALLRVDERRRTYLIASVSNVVLTVALTVTLVVGFDGGARGYVLGNYAASTVVLVGLWVFALRHRVGLDLRAPRTLGPMLRFGAPTVPADAAVFALNVVDRAWLLRADSPAAAGLYAVAVKLATLVIVAVRGFQAAWPPLAYSIVDEDEARHLYALVTTAYVIVTGLVVAGLTLLGRWVVRLLTADPVLPGAQGAAVGGAGLGAVRALPRLRHHRRAREGHHAHLPGRGRRAGGQRRRPRAAGRPARPLGRGHRAVRGLPGDARRRPPAHAAAVHGALRLAAPGARRGDRGRHLGGGRAAAADERRRRLRAAHARPGGHPASRSRPSCCACAASSSQARLNRSARVRLARPRGRKDGPGRGRRRGGRHLLPRHPGDLHDPPVPPRRAGPRQRARARRLRQLGLVRHVEQRHHDHTTANSSPRPASVVDTKTSSLGTFLVDAKGRALYLWDADHGSKSSCSGACAQAWPPLTTTSTPKAGGAGQGLAARHHQALGRLARGHLRRAPALLLRGRQRRPGRPPARAATASARRGGSSRRPARRSRQAARSTGAGRGCARPRPRAAPRRGPGAASRSRGANSAAGRGRAARAPRASAPRRPTP